MNSKEMESSGVLFRHTKLTWEAQYFYDLSVGTVGKNKVWEIGLLEAKKNG